MDEDENLECPMVFANLDTTLMIYLKLSPLVLHRIGLNVDYDALLVSNLFIYNHIYL